jgi:hypothetical protein
VACTEEVAEEEETATMAEMARYRACWDEDMVTARGNHEPYKLVNKCRHHIHLDRSHASRMRQDNDEGGSTEKAG